jgi:hypothetical protein
MSEYQYYEFLAVDRPLTREQMREIRGISTRAEITSTRFTNEYNYGDFSGDPVDFVERFYDAHVYTANWGTRILMFGMPADSVDVKALQEYQIDGGFSVQERRGRVIITFEREDDSGERWTDEDEDEGWMSALIGLRADLMNGDYRATYLGWLQGLQFEGVMFDEENLSDGEMAEADQVEPPVPPGLGSLSASLDALVRFLDIDQDLVAVAAEASPPPPKAAPPDTAFKAWIAGLSSDEKDAIVLRVLQGSPGLQADLQQKVRVAMGPATSVRAPSQRTYGEIWTAYTQLGEERKRREAEAAEATRHRRAEETRRAREAHLASLHGRERDLWSAIEEGVASKKPQEYDRAVSMLVDLRDLADRNGESDGFAARLRQLREAQSRKPSFIQRLDRARLT